MEDSKKVIIRSSLKMECQTFDKWSGEIVLVGDVIYKEREFGDVPIVRLTIDGDGEETFVNDDYFFLIPYLKPIASFRSLLEEFLLKLTGHAQLPIRQGARKYLSEIRNFSEAKSLVRQAKSSVNSLNHEKKDAVKIARNVLEAMGKIATVDYILEIQEV